MKIPKDQIRAYIPQTDPFVMVDNLLYADGRDIRSDFFIQADNIFVDNNELSELALIENIAQSGAAGLSVIKYGESGKIEGFLGGIKNLKLYKRPAILETIETHLQILAELGNMFRLRGQCYHGDERLIECEITVVRVS